MVINYSAARTFHVTVWPCVGAARASQHPCVTWWPCPSIPDDLGQHSLGVKLGSCLLYPCPSLLLLTLLLARCHWHSYARPSYASVHFLIVNFTETRLYALLHRYSARVRLNRVPANCAMPSMNARHASTLSYSAGPTFHVYLLSKHSFDISINLPPSSIFQPHMRYKRF